jgi:cytoskeletal protein CcmA (bactofilin family)
MFNRKDMPGAGNVDTLIGTSTTIEGNIECEGTIRVEGNVKGDMKVNGDVYIGTVARITGNMVANNVHLSGTVEGNIQAKGLLKILSTAKLYGDIEVNRFVTDEGAIFRGKCDMIEAPVPETDTPSEKNKIRKSSSGKEYKKSRVLDQMYDEKEKSV